MLHSFLPLSANDYNLQPPTSEKISKGVKLETMTLYRPVGLKVLELIAQSGFKGFPPRLPMQPIFYPVLTFEYAVQIAREWNTKDPVSGFVGFVTRLLGTQLHLYEIHALAAPSPPAPSSTVGVAFPVACGSDI